MSGKCQSQPQEQNGLRAHHVVLFPGSSGYYNYLEITKLYFFFYYFREGERERGEQRER